MKSPMISVIIPVYNTGYNISKISKRVLKQPYQNIELILINDGSTDDSLKIMQDLEKKDSRIKIFSQENAGPAAARNTGIDRATGEFIMFIDSDDDIDHNMIKKIVCKITRDNLDFVGCGLKLIDAQTGKSRDENTRQLPPVKPGESFKSYVIKLVGMDGRMYGLLGKIYRKSIIDKFKVRFDKGHHYGEDLLFNLNFLACTSKPVAFLPEALYIYYQGTTTSISSKSALVYKNWQKNFEALKKFAGNDKQAAKHLLKIKLHWTASYAKLKLRAAQLK